MYDWGLRFPLFIRLRHRALSFVKNALVADGVDIGSGPLAFSYPSSARWYIFSASASLP